MAVVGDSIFNAGAGSELVPEGDSARQAVASLRGYAYQTVAATLQWLDVDEKSRLFLEVAEDYAVVANQALNAVQVKDTVESGSVTLNSGSIRDAVSAYVDLVAHNPSLSVELRYFTTSKIGIEQAIVDRPSGISGLEYWRRAASGADCSPLRAILESDKFAEPVRTFVRNRDDMALRRDLLRRIQWDCGKPDFSTLRQELEERLVVVGRDRFGLPAPEARRISDFLVYRVLKKSIIKNSATRILTRAELYATIDEATRVSLPRSAVEILGQLTSGLARPLGQVPGSGSFLSVQEMGWLIDSASLPAPRSMIERPAVESAATDAVRAFGVGIIVGSSGLGKSHISRAAGTTVAGTFAMVDFRETDAPEARRRLEMVFAHIGGLSSPLLILEDLNHLDDARVILSLGRVIAALRRRDRTALITCYRKPPPTTLSDVGIDPRCIIDCPYFTEEDTRTLVRMYKGDPEQWARLAYVAGAGGHPQLTHAFVLGLAHRAWPTDEIRNFVHRGLTSNDIEAARDSARRNLPSVLSEGTRNLLYRLSLRSGLFNRSFALAIAKRPPPIPNAGESLDELVGPWIEALGRDLFRVSPLATTFGREMLPPDDQAELHRSIAIEILKKGKIDAVDADAILMHAIVGKSDHSLIALANSILTANPATVELLSEQLVAFPLLRVDAPIYPHNLFISRMLRLAQFKLVAVTGEGTKISELTNILLGDIDAEPEGELRDAFKTLVLSTILSTIGIADYLDNWIDILRRYEYVINNDPDLHHLKSNFEQSGDENNRKLISMLFSLGSAKISTVSKLEFLVDDLDKLDNGTRQTWLEPIEKSFSDYSIFINYPWSNLQRADAFDAVGAVECYRRMAIKTEKWGIRFLTSQCYAAQSALLDEYVKDRAAAFAALDDAVARLGDDVVLARARAKVFWRGGDHAAAVEILRRIADQVGADNPVERAFALREAAMSAAKTDDWLLAESWFLEARSAAGIAETDDMRAMAIGLGADAAVAALESKKVGPALARLAEVLEEVKNVDPEVSLRTAYCHRVVRHTVLWAKSRTEQSDVKIAGKSILMEPGTCSNPDPLPAIKEMPLGPIDLAWYMLAEAEVAGRVDVGIAARIDERLSHGPVPFMESGLRAQRMRIYVDDLDAQSFASNLKNYAESAVYLVQQSARLKESFDVLAPERGTIPTIAMTMPCDPLIEHVTSEAIIAFALRGVLGEKRGSMLELESATERGFPTTFPGCRVFDHWNGGATTLAELEKTVLNFAKIVVRSDYVEPIRFWEMGLRFFEWIDRSNFRSLLFPRLATWLIAGWTKITNKQAFRLTRPLATVPPIEALLTRNTNDRRFIASLILKSADAVGSPLSVTYRDLLKAISEESAS